MALDAAQSSFGGNDLDGRDLALCSVRFRVFKIRSRTTEQGRTANHVVAHRATIPPTICSKSSPTSIAPSPAGVWIKSKRLAEKIRTNETERCNSSGSERHGKRSRGQSELVHTFDEAAATPGAPLTSEQTAMFRKELDRVAPALALARTDEGLSRRPISDGLFARTSSRRSSTGSKRRGPPRGCWNSTSCWRASKVGRPTR